MGPKMGPKRLGWLVWFGALGWPIGFDFLDWLTFCPKTPSGEIIRWSYAPWLT
jgi:hypothetical protein